MEESEEFSKSKLFSIRLARSIFKNSFETDEGFRIAYQANIAVILLDRYGITDHATRNRAANEIMEVIFDAKDFRPQKDDSNKVSRFELLDL